MLERLEGTLPLNIRCLRVGGHAGRDPSPLGQELSTLTKGGIEQVDPVRQPGGFCSTYFLVPKKGVLPSPQPEGTQLVLEGPAVPGRLADTHSSFGPASERQE